MKERQGSLPLGKFVDVQSEPLKPRASIHKSGKLGFNSDAIEFMGLSSGKAFHVALPEGADGPEDGMILYPERDEYPEESRVETAKAGDYYYLHLRNFFDLSGLDYEGFKYRYSIERLEKDGVELYALVTEMEKER